MNFISTLQDEGRVTLENTVSLVNNSWIPSSSSKHFNKCEPILTMNPESTKFKQSIVETINYAREISRMIGNGK